MEEEEHDGRELEGETHGEGSDGCEAVPAEHKVEDEEEGEHPARAGGEDEVIAHEEIEDKDEGQHLAASPVEPQPKSEESEATKIESEGGGQRPAQEEEEVVQDHEGGGGDNDDEDEAATFDPEEGYEQEKNLRNHSRANSDADARADAQPREGGGEVVAIAEPDPSPTTASSLDPVPPEPEPEPLAEPSEAALEPLAEPSNAAPAPEHDEHHAVIPDVVVHDFGQPAEHHREHKEEEEDKAALAAAAGAAVGVVAAAATAGAAASPSAKPVDNNSCAGAAAAGAAAGATTKKKGLSGLLSFAYSPRSFSAGPVAATAAGGGGGASPRRELSSSAPHPPLLSSPRMMVLPSPPPPLHLPKPTPPLGSTVGHDQEPQVVLVQKCWRRRVARRKIHELVMHSRARFKVAEEIAVTEKNYVDVLHTIIEVFMEPLAKQLPGWIAEQSKAKKVKGAPDPLDPALVEIMFGNVKELYKMHKPFAEALQHAIKNWYPYRRMGVLFMDVLLRQNGFLVEYGKYVNGYGAAIKHWNQAMRHPAFARFINTALDNPRCAHLDFCSLIINPVQRVPRYALLLRDIQKHTWAGHGDEESVAHALDKIHIVAEYVNEAKRAAEGMERTTYLQDHIDDKKLAASLSQPQRKYIREGPLKLVHRSDFKDRHVVLFNDIVVITVSKPTGKTSPRLPPSALPTDLCVKGTIELKHSVEAKALDKPERGLQLTVHGKATKWQAATAKDRDEWLRDLQSLSARP